MQIVNAPAFNHGLHHAQDRRSLRAKPSSENLSFDVIAAHFTTDDPEAFQPQPFEKNI